MKQLAIMIATIAVVMALAAVAVRSLHVPDQNGNELAGTGVALVAGLLGLFPVARADRSNVPSLLNKAMFGTITHLLAAVALAVVALVNCPAPQRTALIFWVLGGYWLSLLTLVWLSRAIIIGASKSVNGPAGSNSAAV